MSQLAVLLASALPMIGALVAVESACPVHRLLCCQPLLFALIVFLLLPPSGYGRSLRRATWYFK
jgi:hypothetical protein